MPKSLGTLTAPALASAPAVGVSGALYYNTTDSTLYKSNGSAWSAVGGSGGAPQISDTAPGSPTTGMLWWESDTGALFIYYDSTWVEIGGGPPGPIGQSAIPWTKTGTIAVATGSLRFPLPFDGTILGVSARVGTAPTGADIILDVNKNGTTVFTTQGNRPRIVAGASATAAEVTNMDVTSFAAGDYLTIDIDQVGSTVAGADLTVVVRYRDAYGSVAEMPGLVLITTSSFSATSTVSVDGCFTSAYDRYLIVATFTGSTGMTISGRMRLSGADDSTTNYHVQEHYGSGSTNAVQRLAAATSGRVGVAGTAKSSWQAIVTDPAIAAVTIWDAYTAATAAGTGVELYRHSGGHNVATAYDGFSLITSTGTITGSLAVYGYRKA